MKVSTRNQLKGTVLSIKEGAVNSEVTLEVCACNQVVAVVTNSAVKSLDLKPGKDAYALIKASNVILGIDVKLVSARNVLTGSVASILEGAVNDEVTVDLGNVDCSITAVITKESVKKLGLAFGKEVSAIIKASEVILAVD